MSQICMSSISRLLCCHWFRPCDEQPWIWQGLIFARWMSCPQRTDVPGCKKWLWVTNGVTPKWNPGKWKHGLKPAFCLFEIGYLFEIGPAGLEPTTSAAIALCPPSISVFEQQFAPALGRRSRTGVTGNNPNVKSLHCFHLLKPWKKTLKTFKHSFQQMEDEILHEKLTWNSGGRQTFSRDGRRVFLVDSRQNPVKPLWLVLGGHWNLLLSFFEGPPK